MYTFSKKERLNSKINIHRLFSQGQSLFSYPFKVYYHLEDEATEKVAVSILFSVGKKQFKLAVDRNRVKRLCREAYRLNKGDLINNFDLKNKRLELAFVYVGKSIPEYHDLELRMQKILLLLASVDNK